MAVEAAGGTTALAAPRTSRSLDHSNAALEQSLLGQPYQSHSPRVRRCDTNCEFRPFLSL